MTFQEDRRFISALSRGLDVLSAFSPEKPRMTLSELARKTSLPKSTVVRILFTLVETGYMSFQSSDNTFAPGPKAMTLGLSVVASMDLVSLATPYLESLSKKTGRTVNIGVRDDLSVIYCARVGAHQLLTLNIQVGSRLQLHNTAIGRALVCFSPPDERDALLTRLGAEPESRQSALDIRKDLATTLARGFVVTDRTLAQSVRAIAAPIWKRDNQLAAAINVAFLAETITVEEIVASTAPDLLDAARSISLLLGATRDHVNDHLPR
ncbi:MAG: IclR family transcriptional regulator [Pararhodobacter sp.]|nr:IclR family transcriptional regulator [Pararhodobacter sp.]